MSAEIRNPSNFLHDSEAADMWDGCSADADMGLGFSCSPRKPGDSADTNSRAALPDSAVRQNSAHPRNP
jgi:hypothetical protein